MAEKIRDFMHANLFDVFNERDPERRSAAIAKTYTDHVVFSDPDEIVIQYSVQALKPKRISYNDDMCST